MGRMQSDASKKKMWQIFPNLTQYCRDKGVPTSIEAEKVESLASK